MRQRELRKAYWWAIAIPVVVVAVPLFKDWYVEVNRGDFNRFEGLLATVERRTLGRHDIEKAMGPPDRIGTVADQAWLLKLYELNWGKFDEKCVKVLEYDIVMDGVTPPIPFFFHTDHIYGRVGLDADDRVVAFMRAIQ